MENDMQKPHLRKIFGDWWCFNSRGESRQLDDALKIKKPSNIKAWHGKTPRQAVTRWLSFNRMKP